jgi:hypothetical protein
MQTLESAARVLDILWGIFQPQSVIDVGCATGIWLAECKRKGSKKVCGLDGPWVPKDEIEISADEFIEHDFGQSIPSIIGKYELALCIEVAEHLSQQTGFDLVDFLTVRADVILFSAAIRGQGGTGHVNENKQSYWFERFHQNGFDCFDLVRPAVWNESNVNIIYKQNMLLYVHPTSSVHKKLLSLESNVPKICTKYELDRVHPDLFLMRSVCAKKANLTLRIRRSLCRLKKYLEHWQ